MGDHTRVVVCVVLLAVLGVVASVGTVGASTASADQPVFLSHTDDNAERNGVDRHLSSGDLYWQGQTLWFEDPHNEIDAEGLLLREYDTETEEVGPLVREITFEDNETTLETTDLEGTYVLVLGNSRGTTVDIDDGAVVGTSPVENAAPFEVLEQTLAVEWEGGASSTSGSDREIELRSNRVRYNVNVSSPTLSYTELEGVFMSDRMLRDHNRPFADRTPFGERHRMYDTHADEDVIVLRGFSDGSLETDFSTIETFPDAITVEVTDTGRTETVALPSESPEGGPFRLSSLDISERVDPGESVTITATVTNEWPTTERGEVVFELGEESRSSVGTRLDSGAETTVSTTLQAPTEPGEAAYVVTTDGDSVEGTITVEGSEPESETGDGEESAESGGIINTVIGLLYPQALIGLVMTALSVGTFVVWRRG
jgi:hypothetical protein